MSIPFNFLISNFLPEYSNKKPRYVLKEVTIIVSCFMTCRNNSKTIDLLLNFKYQVFFFMTSDNVDNVNTFETLWNV